MIKPILDNILIQPLEADTQTQSGLYIPETAKEKPQKGKVIEVGTKATSVKKDDIVVFKKWTGDELTLEGKEYKLVKEEDILAIYE